MQPAAMKVGQLAKRTGISVRALHHYDEIGLLSPSRRSASGHRLYAGGEIVRLQQITSLRQLGFSLEEIRDWLDQPDCSPRSVIALHIDRLREQIARQRRLCERLEALAAGLDALGDVSVGAVIEAIEEMRRVEQYYTPEQLEALKERGRVVGEERIREVEAEWPVLMAEVRAEMDKGTDPADPRVQDLARRWMGLVREFTGGDPGITQSLGRMWREETTIHGIDTAGARAMMEYISKAQAAAGDTA